MKGILFILMLCSFVAEAQPMRAGAALLKASVIPPPTSQRFLADFGGNGINDISVSDVGVMTPSNTSTNFPVGIDATTGFYWNNRCNGVEGTWWTDPVDITGAPITGLVISMDIPGADTKPSTSGADSSMNYQGYVGGAVGDYPLTAVRDGIYFNPSGTLAVVNVTIVVPSGKTASVKFWGSRAAATPRIMQIKKSADGSYTQEYDAAAPSGTAGNSDYNQAVTFTGITGTQVFNMRAKSGSTFAYWGILDITIE